VHTDNKGNYYKLRMIRNILRHEQKHAMQYLRQLKIYAYMTDSHQAECGFPIFLLCRAY